MGELAFHHHGDDFHALVRVHAKALARGNRVVIDHPQWTKAHPIGVVVVRKAEAVPAIEPIQLAVKALCCRPQAAQVALRCGGHRCLSAQFERLHLHQAAQQILDRFILGGLGVIAEQLTPHHLGAEVGELNP